jgi:hypothetical protein
MKRKNIIIGNKEKEVKRKKKIHNMKQQEENMNKEKIQCNTFFISK